MAGAMGPGAAALGLPSPLPSDVAERLLGPAVADALAHPQPGAPGRLTTVLSRVPGMGQGKALAAARQLTAKGRKAQGVLQAVPVVSPSNEHLASALKRASKVSGHFKH